jgi:hypothetical protein
MIAPLRRPKPPKSISLSNSRLMQVRRVVATTLLSHSPAAGRSRAWSGWKVWLLVAWLLLVTASVLYSLGAWWRIDPY